VRAVVGDADSNCAPLDHCVEVFFERRVQRGTDSGRASYGEAVGGIGASFPGGVIAVAVAVGGGAPFEPEQAVAAATSNTLAIRAAKLVILMVVSPLSRNRPCVQLPA
jgi:hypothetical protein